MVADLVAVMVKLSVASTDAKLVDPSVEMQAAVKVSKLVGMQVGQKADYWADTVVITLAALLAGKMVWQMAVHSVERKADCWASMMVAWMDIRSAALTEAHSASLRVV